MYGGKNRISFFTTHVESLSNVKKLYGGCFFPCAGPLVFSMIGCKEKKKVGRMSRFLRLGAFLSVLFFATNVFAAGYTCPSYKRYTSCNEGYYLSSKKAGNSCLACPDGYTCSGGTSQPEKAAVANVSIVLNKNGGSGTCAGASGTNKGEVTCTPGNTCTLPSWNSSTCSITNGNKIFKGWSTSSSATTGVTSITTPNASVTYYAVWVTPTCSATNGTCAITTPSNNAPRAKITCKAGYSQNGGTNTTTSFTVTGSAGATSVSGTCKARKEITVTFKSGDTVLGTEARAPGVALPLKDITGWPAPVSSEYGWSLVGLATSVNSTTVAYTNGAEATFEKDTTLYGVWIRPAQFTYIENGEVKRSNQTQYYYNVSTTSAEVTSLTLPGLISSGYGWSPKGWHDEYGNILTYVEKTSLALSPESHSELSAWYQRTVWLVYNGNGSTGGSTASASKTQSYFARFGTSEISSGGFVLAPNGFTRTGYTFSKWAAGSTSGTQYSVNEGFAFPNTAWDSSDSYNMYAIWTLNTYTCAAGKYLNGATCTTCDAGYSCPGGTWTYNGGVQGRTACGGNTKYSSSGAASCSTVSSGYYTTGGTSTTRTGQSQCTGATYCSSGVKYDCPSGYTANTSNGKTAASQCQISCAAGTRVDSQGGACKIPSGNWYTTATQLVNYGNVSTVNYCMAGFSSSSTVATGHDEKTDCVQSVAGGKYIPATQIQARYVKVTTAGSTANAGSHVVEIQAFKTADGTGTNFLYGLGGVSGSNLKAATDGSWAIGNYASGTMIWDMGTVQMLGSIKFALYTDGRVYHDVTVSVSTDNSNWTTVLGPVEVATSATSTAVGDLIVLSAVPESCAAGTYKASTSVALGKTSSCGACANWTYSGAGAASCTSCPTVESGYAKLDSTSTGWTTYTKCVEIASAAPSNCSAGKLQKIPTASGASTWASATVNSSNPLSASAGYYVNGTQCTACGGNNYYCEGGTTARKTVSTGYYTTGGTTTTRTGQSQCTSGTYCTGGVQNTCPSGYGASAAGSDAAADCYMSVAAKKYVKTANDSTATACGTGTYKAAHTVYYGGTSTCDSCPSGYDDGAAVATQGECVISVAGGKYIGTAKSATLSTCAGGTYKASHTVAYGSTSSCATCSAGYYCPQGAGSQTACGSNAKYSGSGAAACSDVSSGYYTTGGTSTTRTGQTKCEAGNYCSSGVKTACGGGKWSSAGATSCSSITAGCYGTSAGSACPAVCGDAQYSDAGAASCSGCPADYKNSGTSASNHAGSASCKITVDGGYYIGTAGDNSSNWDKCAGGTYKASHKVAYGSTSSCATCSAGYYCPAGASSQTACGGNTKYSSSGAASCTTVTSGYYTTGGTSTTRTGQTKCEAGNYCSGGVKAACGGGKYSSAGATSCSNITAGCYGTSASTACPAVCGTNQYSNAGAASCSSCPTDYKNSGTEAASHAGSASCIITVSGGYYIGTAGDNSSNWDKCAGGTYKAQHTVKYGDISSCATCSAGYYCPAGASTMSACSALGGGLYVNSVAGSDAAGDCYFKTTGGKYLANATDTAQTTCEARYYCPTTTLYYPNTGGRNSCPDPTSSTYMEKVAEMGWLTERCPTATTSNSSLVASKYQTWANTGLSAITQCPASMGVSTPCAHFNIETARYNSSTGRYDSDVASIYTDNVKAGYYLYERYSSTYCDKGGTLMLMRKAAVCPKNSYCPGGSVPRCNSGTYVTEYGKYACTSLGSFYTTTASTGSTASSQCYGTTTAGKYIKTQNSSTQETCPAGSYCPATTVYYGKYDTSGGRTACPAGTMNASTGSTASSACKTCAAGTYNTTTGNTTCSSCGTGYYCTGGSARTQCTSTSGWTTTTSSATSTSYSACYQTQTPSGCASGVIKRSASSISGTTITYGSASVSTSLSAKANYYVSGTSCPVCTGLGSFYTTSAGGAINSSKCYGTTTAGKYIKTQNSSTQETCPAGSYCPATNVFYGNYDTSGGRTACPAGTMNASTGSTASSACKTCAAGTYNTTTGNTTCSSCGTGYYCTGGSARTQCTSTSGWTTTTSSATSTSYSACYQTQTPSGCASGVIKRSASSISGTTITYGSASVSTSLSAKANYYVSGTSCPVCTGLGSFYTTSAGGAINSSKCYGTTTAGKYIKTQNSSTQETCPAGSYCPATNVFYGNYDTSGGRTACPSGYGASAAGSDAAADCYMSVAAKNYVKTANDSSATACGTGTYKAAHTVYYGGTSTCDSCPSGYDDGAAVATQGECVISVAGGKYIGTAKSATLSTCAGGTYKAAHTVAYGSTSSCATCSAGYYCPAGASGQTACGSNAKYSGSGAAACSDVSSGYYTTGGTSTTRTGQTKCEAGNYCSGGVKTACSTLASGFYPNSAAGSDAAADCYTNVLRGKYVASVNATGATSCAAGTFKGSHQVNYGSKSSCDACALGSYSAAGASACTACQSGKTTSGTGKSSCDATCENNNSYNSTWATATWSDNAVANLCQIATCAGGSRYTSVNGAAAGTLPSGYTQLAYLESTGTQAIDTKTVLQTDNVEFEWTAVDKSTASYTTLFGSETSSNPKYTGILHGSNTSRTLYYGSIPGKGVGYSAGAELARWKLLLTDMVRLYKNDVMVSSELEASSLQKSLPIAVFASNLRGSMGQFSSVQMYSFKIWDGGKLVLNLIPAMRDSDGALGMYDTVNNRFLVNAGSGKFVAGPIILKSQNTCTQCAAGTYSAGGTATSCGTCANWTYSSAGAASCTACLAVESGWTKASGTGWKSYASCKETKTGDAISSNCSAGVLTKEQSSATAWGSATITTALQADAGSIVNGQTCTQCSAGTYSAGGTATSCGTCANWTYSSAGAASCSACLSVPDAVGGVAWTKATGTGWTSYSNCVVSQTPANCASGSVKRTQSSATAWGGTTLVSTLKSKAGYYASTTATACTICPVGSYCPASATSATACATGSYTNATGKSECTACSAGKTTTGTGKTSCDANCSNATGAHTWATPSWSANSVANLCTVSKCNANTYYTATTGNGYKNTCTACGSNSSTSAGNTSTTCTCTTGYTSTGGVSGATTSTSGCSLISDIACAIGQYLPASSTSCLACTAGYYCPSSAKTYSYSSSIQGRKECSAGTYQPDTGKTSCTPASKGYYVSGTAKTAQTACTGATYAANTGQSSCTACPTATNNASKATSYSYWNNGGTADHTTVTGCYVHYSNDTVDNGSASLYYCYADTDAATTGEYGVDGTSKGCWVYWDKLKCDGGYYNKNYSTSSNYDFTNKTIAKLKANACQNVGAGYWSANDALTRTACASPLTTIGYGTAANEAEDCGRKLHAGANVIYLRSAARTSPSLRVKVGNTTFYGALSTSLSSPVKVKNGSTTYSVVNDWQ